MRIPTRSSMDDLLREIRNCKVCEKHLPNPPRPILRASGNARILIVGQSPGRKVQESGVPWDDLSGDTLREWLGLTDADFYDETKVAIMPTGFCYPGKGKSGDLPPRPECAPIWHPHLLRAMKQIRLTLLIGTYAQAYYLKRTAKPTLTETVRSFREYLPSYFPLPHPSPRNRIWLRRNRWFEDEIVANLRHLVTHILD
jgi:uracil-DNA glycosylase